MEMGERGLGKSEVVNGLTKLLALLRSLMK